MIRTLASLTEWLPLLSRRHLLVFVCSLLTLWAALDSSVLAQFGLAGSGPHSPPGVPPQESNDDEMVDLSGWAARQKATRRKARLPSAASVRKLFFPLSPFALTIPPSLRSIASVGEHERRNGIGAPLLC